MEEVGGEKRKEQSEQRGLLPLRSKAWSQVSFGHSFPERQGLHVGTGTGYPVQTQLSTGRKEDISPPLTWPDLERGRGKELKVWERKQTDNKGLGPQS